MWVGQYKILMYPKTVEIKSCFATHYTKLRSHIVVEIEALDTPGVPENECSTYKCNSVSATPQINFCISTGSGKAADGFSQRGVGQDWSICVPFQLACKLIRALPGTSDSSPTKRRRMFGLPSEFCRLSVCPFKVLLP